MHIKGIAAAAYSGTTKSSAKIPTLLHHLLIAPRQQLTDTLHVFTGIKGLLFIRSAQYFNVDSRHARKNRQGVWIIKSQTTCYSNGRRPPRKVITLRIIPELMPLRPPAVTSVKLVLTFRLGFSLLKCN